MKKKKTILLVALLTFSFIVVFFIYRNMERERWIVEYQTTELQRLGIDCNKSRDGLSESLKTNLGALIADGREGKNWRKRVTPKLIDEFDRYREVFFHCTRVNTMRKEDKSGQTFSQIHESVSVILTILKYGDEAELATKKQFERIEKEYNQLQKILASPSLSPAAS